VGVYTVSADVDSRGLIRRVILRKEEWTMREKVEKVLETIRPALQADGGDVELVDVIDGIVKVRLKGACSG
jgi:Fe-S cluster biogenesis protein NfuA